MATVTNLCSYLSYPRGDQDCIICRESIDINSPNWQKRMGVAHTSIPTLFEVGGLSIFSNKEDKVSTCSKEHPTHLYCLFKWYQNKNERNENNECCGRDSPIFEIGEEERTPLQGRCCVCKADVDLDSLEQLCYEAQASKFSPSFLQKIHKLFQKTLVAATALTIGIAQLQLVAPEEVFISGYCRNPLFIMIFKIGLFFAKQKFGRHDLEIRKLSILFTGVLTGILFTADPSKKFEMSEGCQKTVLLAIAVFTLLMFEYAELDEQNQLDRFTKRLALRITVPTALFAVGTYVVAESLKRIVNYGLG